MKTSLEHLPAEKQLLVNDIVKTIVEKIKPEKVILFGSHATGKWQEHEYKEEGRWFEVPERDYDILVITREGDRRSDYEVQDIAEYRSGLRDIISVITHDITYINGKLSDGQYFFSDIQKEGVLLYDAGITPLATRRELTDAEKKSMACDDFVLWFDNGQEFLIDGKNAAARGKYKKAAFELRTRRRNVFTMPSSLVFLAATSPKHITSKSSTAIQSTIPWSWPACFRNIRRKKRTCSSY